MGERASPALWQSRSGRDVRTFGPARRTARLRAVPAGALVRLIEGAHSWRERARCRRVLARLDDRMLRDLGIVRAVVEGESTNWLWRLRKAGLEMLMITLTQAPPIDACRARFRLANAHRPASAPALLS